MREEDEGGIKGQLDFAELELGQLLGEPENAVDQFGLDRVRRVERSGRKQRIAEQHRILHQVVVATHPDDGQLETSCCCNVQMKEE